MRAATRRSAGPGNAGLRAGTAIVALAALLVLSFVPADAADSPSKCTARKYRAASDAVERRAECWSKAARKGRAVDPDCLAKAARKLAKAWRRAEKRGDCITVGDVASAQASVDAIGSLLTDLLEPPPLSPSPCCQTEAGCYHGLDAEGCSFVLGTMAPAGSVCDGASGRCGAPPASSGRCCTLFGVCSAGPDVDLAGCVEAGGLDCPICRCTSEGACQF